jgi:hypothetical protein
MTDCKTTICLNQIERDIAEASPAYTGKADEHAGRSPAQLPETRWPELFAAIGGDKMVGDGKPD